VRHDEQAAYNLIAYRESKTGLSGFYEEGSKEDNQLCAIARRFDQEQKGPVVEFNANGVADPRSSVVRPRSTPAPDRHWKLGIEAASVEAANVPVRSGFRGASRPAAAHLLREVAANPPSARHLRVATIV